MKFICVKCGAKYYHNHAVMKPPTKCRFCGAEMVKDKMTSKEFNEIYLNPESELHNATNK